MIGSSYQSSSTSIDDYWKLLTTMDDNENGKRRKHEKKTWEWDY